MIRRAQLSLVCVVWSVTAMGQTHASCTFTFFPQSVSLPNIGPTPWRPTGINDFGTVVGVAFSGSDFGIVRWAGGGMTSIFGTLLFDRNDKGISIGSSVTENLQPILLTGTAVTLLTLGNLTQFNVSSINDWGSIVGSYVPPGSSSVGFKMWSNGGFIPLRFPNSVDTFPMSINDSGTIAGFYSTDGQQGNGFIYANGQWATLNFPNSTSTALLGISNAGRIVGNAVVNGSSTAFLYESGEFRIISPPGAADGATTALATSARLGLIVGLSTVKGVLQGFIARCQ
jgi:hypothetical protein